MKHKTKPWLDFNEDPEDIRKRESAVNRINGFALGIVGSLGEVMAIQVLEATILELQKKIGALHQELRYEHE
jgi:hypothetical protein